MNYPFWQVPAIGGGLLIAIIAILHVYIAHLAVGGGLFLVLTERKARREQDEGLLAYVKKHTRFFLLLTMVFGGVTGVGIWFIISLVHPQGTSALIHNFVFGWAIEWTFFIGEIVALLLYYYLWDRLAPKVHMALGWLYFIFAWLSLFVINGILTFMLTPGRWSATLGFWDGFFNPTFWPSLLFRTGMALTIAGIFGLVTAAFSKEPYRQKVIRYCGTWILVPFALTIVGGLWYLGSIPAQPLENIQIRNPEVIPFTHVFLWTSAIVFVGGLIALLRLSPGLQRLTAVVVMLIGLSWIGGFEYVREIARKPYVIFGYMYSSGVTPAQAEQMSETGFLSQAKWAVHKEVTPENRIEAGKELLTHQCLICHTVGGYNDVLKQTAKHNLIGMTAQLSGQGKINTYMPPFLGTEAEKDALAGYLIEDLHGKQEDPFPAIDVARKEFTVPEFDPENDDYVLLAWNDLGMHCLSDSDPWWVILPPANSLWAQLVRRGPSPEFVTEGVELRYEVETGFEHPERHVEFWDHVASNFGATLEPPTGLAGNAMSGHMEPKEGVAAFVAELVPVVPYPDSGIYDPYPTFTIEAYDTATGERIAQTRMVAPTSSEMGCKNCHGGEWRFQNQAGFTAETSRDILRVHDRMSRTNLLAEAEAGSPKICGACHQDLALGTEGDPELLNLPTAIHGFHANYMPDMEETACLLCHPSRWDGATRCLRGRHGSQVGLTCVECHGTLEDHALSLVKHEHEAGKKGAARLMAHLEPDAVASVEEINGRMPWIHEPDCLNCHRAFELPDSVKATITHQAFLDADVIMQFNAFNEWTTGGDQLYRNRTDSRGVMCIACHGSPHAIYPAENAMAEDLDNIPPLQYQGIAGTIGTETSCTVCHTVPRTQEGHHRRILYRD